MPLRLSASLGLFGSSLRLLQDRLIGTVKVDGMRGRETLFADDGSSRKMLVEVRRKGGGIYPISVRLSSKVAEAEIVAFLVGKGLAHLYGAGEP